MALTTGGRVLEIFGRSRVDGRTEQVRYCRKYSGEGGEKNVERKKERYECTRRFRAFCAAVFHSRRRPEAVLRHIRRTRKRVLADGRKDRRRCGVKIRNFRQQLNNIKKKDLKMSTICLCVCVCVSKTRPTIDNPIKTNDRTQRFIDSMTVKFIESNSTSSVFSLNS